MKRSYTMKTWGVLEMRTPSISPMQPVMADAAEDDRKGKQALVRPSPFWQVK